MHLAPSASHTDAINARILAVSEDCIQGFVRDPMAEIARRCELPVDTVIERIRAMLRGGTIRRVRQTLMATDLAPGALVAWEVDADKLDAAFETMFRDDPFSGHVVVRSTDTPVSGSQYKLWTTLKVPHGFSMAKHADYLRDRVGAHSYRLMPAKGIFALGVGHTRRSSMELGAKSAEPAEMHTVRQAKLNELEWRVLTALKRETKSARRSGTLVRRKPTCRCPLFSRSPKASTNAGSSADSRPSSSTSSRRRRASG
jgi:DNA-binding Lrp family transcriptional regulator